MQCQVTIRNSGDNKKQMPWQIEGRLENEQEKHDKRPANMGIIRITRFQILENQAHIKVGESKFRVVSQSQGDAYDFGKEKLKACLVCSKYTLD